MEKLRAVGVIRVSTATQADSDHFGPQAQAVAIEKLVAQHNLQLVETISYSDVSGADVLYAPEMQRLLGLIARPDITAVVACEFSRLVRPGFDDYPLLQKFVQANITLYLPSGPIKLADAHGQFFATIQGAIAALERHTIKARLMGGREEARKLGYCAAGSRTIPTGVLWDSKAKRWSYDPLVAPKIREAFRMFAAGETNFQAIIEKLQLKLRPARGAPRLADVGALRRLLENRLFVGERVIDKKFDLTTPRDQLRFVGKDGKLHRRNPPLIARAEDEVIRVKVIEKPLVPVEVFERVQQILRAKSDRWHQQHARRAPSQFAYRGLLFCADCGSPLYTVGSGEFTRYRCKRAFAKWAGAARCKSPALRRAQLDAALDQFFSREFTRGPFFKQVFLQHTGSEERKARARRRDDLLAQLDAVAKKRGRVIEFALEGTITKQDRDRRLLALDAEAARIERELGATAETPLPTYAEWQELLKPFRRGFSGLPSNEKRRLITARFEKIAVRDYRVVSVYLLTGEPAAIRPEAAVTSPSCAACERAGALCERCQAAAEQAAARGVGQQEAARRGRRGAKREAQAPILAGVRAAVESSQGL